MWSCAIPVHRVNKKSVGHLSLTVPEINRSEVVGRPRLTGNALMVCERRHATHLLGGQVSVNIAPCLCVGHCARHHLNRAVVVADAMMDMPNVHWAVLPWFLVELLQRTKPVQPIHGSLVSSVMDCSVPC